MSTAKVVFKEVRSRIKQRRWIRGVGDLALRFITDAKADD